MSFHGLNCRAVWDSTWDEKSDHQGVTSVVLYDIAEEPNCYGWTHQCGRRSAAVDLMSYEDAMAKGLAHAATCEERLA